MSEEKRTYAKFMNVSSFLKHEIKSMYKTFVDVKKGIYLEGEKFIKQILRSCNFFSFSLL